MKMNNLFSRNLKRIMSQKNLNQKELAKIAGCTESAMSRYVNGERLPHLQVMVKIANALNLTIDELIRG